MTSKLQLLGGAFLLASVLGLAGPARAEGVASTPPAAAAAPAAAPRAQPRVKRAGKGPGKSPAPAKAGAAATPAAAPAPAPEKLQELQKHPEARSGRGHL